VRWLECHNGGVGGQSATTAVYVVDGVQTAVYVMGGVRQYEESRVDEKLHGSLSGQVCEERA
jgi:hypothetical protein